MLLKSLYVCRQLGLVIKLRFSKVEAGAKELRFALIGSDGEEVHPTLETSAEFEVEDGVFEGTGMIVMEIQDINLPRYGDYAVHLLIDGVERVRLPFTLRGVPEATG